MELSVRRKWFKRQQFGEQKERRGGKGNGREVLRQASNSGVGPPNATVGTGETEDTARAGLKSAVAEMVVARKVARTTRARKRMLKDLILLLNIFKYYSKYDVVRCVLISKSFKVGRSMGKAGTR